MVHRPLVQLDPLNDPGARRLLWAIVCLLVIGAAVVTWIQGPPYVNRPGAPLLLLLGILLIVVLQRGWYRATAYSIVWGLLLVSAFTPLLASGPYSASWLVVPLPIVISGWLCGWRNTVIMTLVSLLASTLTYQWQLQGHVFQILLPHVMYMTQLVVFVLAAIIGVACSRTFGAQVTQLLAMSHSLQQNNDELEQNVAARTSELSATVLTLQRTQRELVEAGKLAALGNMVAGISHELNTPIGNSLTVASTFRERFAEMTEKAQSGQLRRSELDEFLRDGAVMAELVERANQGAARMIGNFKQVAVDQTSELRRVFDLREVVEGNLDILTPGYKREDWVFVNEVPPDLRCDSYPGPLGQVLSNLVQNAIIHGFEGRDHGEVHIRAQVQGDAIALQVVDDGMGITPEVLPHLFEPFFTTKLGQGGSGLGLSISHRLATEILGGTLSVESCPGKGSTFTLRFPRTSPLGPKPPE
jgi:signal transduction histidine kinase